MELTFLTCLKQISFYVDKWHLPKQFDQNTYQAYPTRQHAENSRPAEESDTLEIIFSINH